VKKIRASAAYHLALLLVAAAAVAWFHLRAPSDRLRRTPTAEELARALGGKPVGPMSAGGLSYYTTANGGRAAAVTMAVPPRVRGYVDEINALVAVDREGRIVAVEIVDSRETPSYLERVLAAGFLDRFLGRRSGEARAIDTVTGATISSRALKADVAATAAALADEVYGLPSAGIEAGGYGVILRDPRLWALWLGFAVALYARLGKWPRWRRELSWAVAVAAIGIVAMTPYTLVHTFQLLKFDLPGRENLVFLSLAGFVLVTTLALGPMWCAYACPFGALQELLALLPVPKWRVTPRLMGRARELRYLTLTAATVLVFGFGVAAAGEVEPFYHLFGRAREPLAWVFIGATLFFALFVKRFWCRFFCPTGLCLILLSSHRRWWTRVEAGVAEAGIDRPDREDSAGEVK
jgi:hypothetical protein